MARALHYGIRRVVRRENRMFRWVPVAIVVISLVAINVRANDGMKKSRDTLKGYNLTETGLRVRYPKEFECPKLTSFYASWVDVDGTRRDEIHTGVDGGDLGDWILAPASGTIGAVWETNWRWGLEGALLIIHDNDDVNLDDDPPHYFSEFDHLDYDEIKGLRVGDRVQRGQRLARVFRPGGRTEYLPEVHWEVWEAQSKNLTWTTNERGSKVWRSPRATLIDPLYMLAIDAIQDGGTTIDRKSTRLNSSHPRLSRMPSSA